jgi:rare lipoprotein A
VRVNDRGPYHNGRVIDVSSRVAQVLDFKGAGSARVKVDYVGPAPMEGSDDWQLLASLRTDGSPAGLIGYPAPVMMAAAPVETIFSFFSGGRGAAPPREPEPEPAPVQVASRPAPAPAPEPEPVRVASFAPPPAAETPRAPPPASIAVRQPKIAPPLPPPRPFDLGANRTPVLAAAARSQPQHAVIPPQVQHVVIPPRRPNLQASAERALYFSDPAVPRLDAPARAFDRLNSAVTQD